MTKAANETPEQRENRLVKARKQACKTREQAMKEKYRDKILEDLRKEEESENDSDAPVVPAPAPAPVVPVVPEVPVVPAPAPVKKPRKKPAAKIIVEQDSDDSDFFEDKPNIIFVKRVTKKKENIPPPAPTPTYTPTPLPVYPRPSPNPVPVPQYAPPVPVRPPEITPQQRLLAERCKNMSNGNFLPVSRPRM
jgi:hypothetical protein